MSISPLLLHKALSDQTRFQILVLLQSQGSLCVCELEAALKEEQPKISRHLALLRKQEILTSERRGKWIYYAINPDLSSWVEDLLIISLENSKDMMQVLFNNLDQMRNRPACCG